MSTTHSPASVRRYVQTTLNDPTDPVTVRNTVLRELRAVFPGVTLEDCLELVVLVPPPREGSRDDQIETVLTVALAYLDQWGRLARQEVEP